MNTEKQELNEVITDLKLIKEAVSRSDSIIRFIDTGGALKSILLSIGLMIVVFSTIFYYLTDLYGSFGAIPLNIRVALFVVIGMTWCILGFLKIRNFLKGAREIGEDMTFFRLFDEIYTPRLLALQLPYMLVMTLTIIFLNSRGQLLFIIPVLSILFGLLLVSLSPLVFQKEFYFLSIWLIATGLLALFTAEIIHPMAALVITFAAGFLLTALLLYFSLPVKERPQR